MLQHVEILQVSLLSVPSTCQISTGTGTVFRVT